MPNKDFDKNKFNFAQLFNLIAVDLDGDGMPDAICVCSPEGNTIGSVEEQPSGTDINIDKDQISNAEVVNEIAVDVNDDGSPDAVAIVNPDGSIIGE